MPTFPPSVSAEARDFVSASLCKTAQHRLSIKDMLQHGWVESYRNRRSQRHPPSTVAAAAAAAADGARAALRSSFSQPSLMSSEAPLASYPIQHAALLQQQQQQLQQQQQTAQSHPHPFASSQSLLLQSTTSAPPIPFSIASILSAMTDGGRFQHQQQQQQGQKRQIAAHHSFPLCHDQALQQAQLAAQHKCGDAGDVAGTSPKTRLSAALCLAASAEGLGSVIMTTASMQVQQYISALCKSDDGVQGDAAPATPFGKVPAQQFMARNGAF